MVRNFAKLLARLHRDEQGAEGLEKLLIVAAIVLPLLGALIWFRKDLEKWVSAKWEEYRTPALDQPVVPTDVMP